jgi:hypothetical protein
MIVIRRSHTVSVGAKATTTDYGRLTNSIRPADHGRTKYTLWDGLTRATAN